MKIDYDELMAENFAEKISLAKGVRDYLLMIYMRGVRHDFKVHESDLVELKKVIEEWLNTAPFDESLKEVKQ